MRFRNVFLVSNLPAFVKRFFRSTPLSYRASAAFADVGAPVGAAFAAFLSSAADAISPRAAGPTSDCFYWTMPIFIR